MSKNKVVGIDHLVLRVGDFEKSKTFYASLFEFLGFELRGDMIGWTNAGTRFPVDWGACHALADKSLLSALGRHGE